MCEKRKRYKSEFDEVNERNIKNESDEEVKSFFEDMIQEIWMRSNITPFNGTYCESCDLENYEPQGMHMEFWSHLTTYQGFEIIVCGKCGAYTITESLAVR